ncbi:MAG: EpsI family protein [Desulfobacteraceae bacterium]|nr:EpsI family protein [Desulfobacteraceae bacterium]MBC2720380.1 EpsI family protein [Desulfobacteraceae bacterium]
MKNSHFITSVTLLLLTIATIFGIASRGMPVVIHKNLDQFPEELMNMVAREIPMSQRIVDELRSDVYIFRKYVPKLRSTENFSRESSPTGVHSAPITLYIGYYGTAKGGRTPHNPYACFPSSGWGVVKTNTVIVRPEGYTKPVQLNYLLVQQGDVFKTVLHWYQSAGNKVLKSGLDQNIQRFISRVLYNRNDGAFIRVTVDMNSKKIGAGEKLTTKFAKKVLTLLHQYWPEEK